MSESPPSVMPQIVPYLYYEDAGPAIEFMEKAFGFEIASVFRSPDDDRVLHAQLRTGSGVIFVGPGMEFFGTQGPPDPELTSAMTYVFVVDVDAHYAHSTAAGVRVRDELHLHPGGNRQYTVIDPGGQRWTFAQPASDD